MFVLENGNIYDLLEPLIFVDIDKNSIQFNKSAQQLFGCKQVYDDLYGFNVFTDKINWLDTELLSTKFTINGYKYICEAKHILKEDKVSAILWCAHKNIDCDYYSNIMDKIEHLIFWHKFNENSWGCNLAMANFLGIKAHDSHKFKDDVFIRFMGVEHYEQYQLTAKDIIISQQKYLNEEIWHGTNKTPIEFLVEKTPLRDINENIIGVVAIAKNLTAQKNIEKQLLLAKEQAEIADQVKSDFIACMSHDLRTHLSGIFGAVQVLKRNPYSSEQEQFFEGISQSSNNLLFLIEDILNFAKLEAGKIILCPEPFDLRRLVEEVINLFAHQAQEKNLKLIISYCDSVPCFVQSDPSAIRRILINLIGNAIKFTEIGHVFVSVELMEPIENNGGETVVQLMVEDTGIGIPKEKTGVIFDKFSRLNPSYNGRYHGTGLGLTIAKQLTESLGGTMHVHSQLNFGSTFWFELPIKLQNQALGYSKWQEYYSKIRVLIVDDYEVSAKITHKQLIYAHNVVCGSDKAIEHLIKAAQLNNPFDIVIIDDEINNCSAISLAKSIYNQQEFRNLMLILFSRPSTLAESEMAKEAGFFRQIIKPIYPKEMLQELCNAWVQWDSVITEKRKNTKQKYYKVLLVEDDSIAQMINKTMLQNLNCEVDVATTGQQAYYAAKKYNYDIIFMDIGLPDIDGVKVTKKIIADKGEDFDVPIIGLTAHAFEKNQLECIEAGMTAFVTKPVSYEDFEQIFAYHLLNKELVV